MGVVWRCVFFVWGTSHSLKKRGARPGTVVAGPVPLGEVCALSGGHTKRNGSAQTWTVVAGPVPLG